MALRQYTVDACESIDASVFSGELLFDDESIAQLEEYMGRWQRAIARQRELNAKQDAQT